MVTKVREIMLLQIAPLVRLEIFAKDLLGDGNTGEHYPYFFSQYNNLSHYLLDNPKC